MTTKNLTQDTWSSSRVSIQIPQQYVPYSYFSYTIRR